MHYGTSEDQTNWGVIMKNKGFTLVEAILAIALIGLIAAFILPGITFGFTNLFSSAKFTDSAFEAQQSIELVIEEKRKEPLEGAIDTDTISVFGKSIIGHVVSQDIESGGNVHGQLNAFIPKPVVSYTIPVIESAPEIKVRQNNVVISPQPTTISILDTNKNLFVSEINITNETKSEFLMNIYRWYYYDSFDNNANPDNKEYLTIKEWNEARKLLSYEESEDFGFIPNIKNNYNILRFSEFGINDEELIQRFGNKYVRYSVTPYSIIGKIGKEEFSNQIFIEAPKLKVVEAGFLVEIDPDTAIESSNRILIRFDQDIRQDGFDTGQIDLNVDLGEYSSVYKSTTDNKALVIEFTNDFNLANIYANNYLNKGAVESDSYGKLEIDNGVNGFTINNKYY